MRARTAILTLLLAAPALAQASSPTELQVVSAKIRLDGNSTLHPWSATATTLNAKATVDGGLPGALDGRAVKLELAVPVAALRSGESGLDENLRKALHQKEHPFVLFKLDGLKVDGDRLTASGRLAISGEERPVAFTASAKSEGDALRVQGTVSLKMTDFKVEPPVLFFGAIKTADEVTVGFDITWKAKEEKQS